MKNTKIFYTFAFIIVLVLFIISAIIYPSLPGKIITHWDANGTANGYSSKLFGLFFLPIITLVLLVLFFFIPKIDPLKKNIEKFKGYYALFVLLFVLYMAFIHVISILLNYGMKINIMFFILPAMGLLFFFLGALLEKTKRNFFIGIRTPWTLSSDKVWGQTHKLGGKLFKICGVIAILGLFFTKYAIWFILVPILASVIVLVIYSYVKYTQIKK